MPARQLSQQQVASELLQTLDENNLDGFVDTVQMGLVVEFDWERKYGKESGHKTILQLALEEDDGEPYVEALLKAGARANDLNAATGSAPIHTAASEALPEIFQLLFKFPDNRADINVVTKDGLSAYHILLAKLIDLSNLETKPLQNRGSNAPTDEDIETSMINVMECLYILTKQKDLRLSFNSPLNVLIEKSVHVKSRVTLKKMCTMTPLQLLCSFQPWNAKPINDELHAQLADVISLLLEKGVDPNATAHVGKLPGTVPGSTPAVLLAATRGYHKIVDLLKKDARTNFLIENKFQQTILHIVLKAGYYNKVSVHGEDSGEVNARTLRTLFDDNHPQLQRQMSIIINRKDTYGNTALHYAKPYHDQSLARLLLLHGAKLDRNDQNVINVQPRTLEEHFFEECVGSEGDDIDDEDYKIWINFKLFEKANVSDNANLDIQKQRAKAWTMDIDDNQKKRKDEVSSAVPRYPSSGKVDTKRLEYFSNEGNMRYLLKHPVLTSFLEMELNSLKYRYLIDFVLYLVFVIVLFIFLSERYGLVNISTKYHATLLHEDKETDLFITYAYIALCIVLLLQILREIYQMFQVKKRYFTSTENYLEWMVIILVALNLLPGKYIGEEKGHGELKRHIASFTLLLAFTQLYLLLVRIVPNTPVPMYINMFTTVLKTYILIILSYLAFILSFAYSFYLIFNPGDNLAQPLSEDSPVNATNATSSPLTDANNQQEVTGDPLFATSGLSIVKTLVMFIGEMDYNDLMFRHWLGYIIFILFLFLVVIVLMNILNGLAVSDISKIRKEVDTYYHISIVETLAYTSFVSLLAEEIVLFPNIRPQHQKIFGLSIPGTRVYKALGGKLDEPEGKKTTFYFREDTVKSAKELISLKVQQGKSVGMVTLDTVTEDISDVMRELNNVKHKFNTMEEKIQTILEIMVSRHPQVERL